MGYALSYFFDIDMFQAKLTYLLKLSGSFSVRNLLYLFLFLLRMFINVGTKRYKDEHERNCKSAIFYVNCRISKLSSGFQRSTILPWYTYYHTNDVVKICENENERSPARGAVVADTC